jgi:3-hydroxybutyryl-CoA dehydratase
MHKIQFDSIEPGYQLPSFTRSVSQEVFWKYAVASFDYNPVHCDPDWVRTAQPFGIPQTVAHGMMTMSFMMSVVTNWAYPAMLKITKTESKFVKPVLPGWTITCKGVVSEKHVICPGKNYVVIDVRAENQDGELVGLSRTEVQFPD